MHALETIRTALRPQGLLLDVRPAPQHPWVELQRVSAAATADGGRRVVRLGQIDDSYRLATLAVADAALQSLIEARRFVRERTETFTFIYHFDGVATWLAYMGEQWSSAYISKALTMQAQTEERIAAAPGDLRVLRAIHASRLRRQ